MLGPKGQAQGLQVANRVYRVTAIEQHGAQATESGEAAGQGY